MTRPTWAEVDLTSLRHNFRTLLGYVAPDAAVMAVVKCDAYGHGAAACAQALEAEGAQWFGVTCADEGVALRRAGIGGRILLLSGFWRGEEAACVEHRLTPVVWTREHVELLDRAAAAAGVQLPVHWKVETGMARLGSSATDWGTMIDALRAARALQLEGMLTHLASSDVIHSPQVEMQEGRFAAAVAEAQAAGLKPQFLHSANSSAVASRPQTWHNLVRPGISLYGYFLPFTSAVTGTPEAVEELTVKPVLQWKTRVIGLRDVPAGQPLGYGGAYVCEHAARIAALPVGYGDGLSRQLSSRGRVIVRGDYASMVGNVSMDLTLVDVTGIPGVEIGDEVVLIGSAGERSIGADEHAQLASTIPYEILCNISKRVPRLYVE